MDANEMLKKGVPVQLPLPVEFEINDLARICKNSNITPVIEEARKKVFELFSKQFGVDIPFMFFTKENNVAEIYTDPDTLDKKIVMTGSVILNRIELALGNFNIEYYDTEEMNNLIEDVKNMDEDEMERVYPVLYKLYLDNKMLIRALSTHKQNFKQMSVPKVMYREKTLADLYGISVKDIDTLIKKSSANYGYSDFLNKFVKALEIVRDNKEKFISPSLSNNDYFVDINAEIALEDQDKFSMYTAYLYQERLKIMKDEYKQGYLYYISAYYFENKDKLDSNMKIFSQYYDKIIKLSDMYEDYKKILVNNPQLKIVDFDYGDFNGMTLDEVNEFIDEYLKTINVNWDFLTASNLDEQIISKIKDYYTRGNKEFNQEDLEKAVKLFMEKKEFFDRSDPYRRIMGKNSFDGYIGYIYKNGSVVLEKFFENSKTGKIAINQAIYAMNVNEFYYITSMSKNEIIANKLCNRFIHKGDWKTKVEDYITNNNAGVDVVSEVSALNSNNRL